MTTLTTAAIRAAIAAAAKTGQAVELFDTTGSRSGLRVRCYPSGTATYSVVARDGAGKVRRFLLGPASGATIAEARTAAARVKFGLMQGVDPRAVKLAAKAAAAPAPKAGPTLQDVIAQYERVKTADKKSWPITEKRIRVVFGELLKRPARDITLAEFQRICDAHPSPKSLAPIAASLKAVFRWASAGGRELVDERLIRAVVDAKVTERERVLSTAELARLLPVLRAEQDTNPHAAVLMMLLWTACRRDEVALSTWQDIDLAAGTLTVPRERSKNGRQHVITLPTQARTLLTARRPAEPDPAALVFARPGSDRIPLASWTLATAKVQAASSTAGWHRHDLRRTAASTLGADLKVSPYIIDAVLNHTPPKITRTYNASTYEADRADALQRLADRYDAIAGLNVVQMVA